ncbi:MAG: hypothetical protein MZU91_00850, partial [Desulfosudis oleivorans]|nr:hypothetical protein [Desulfosudis oleivorans]
CRVRLRIAKVNLVTGTQDSSTYPGLARRVAETAALLSARQTGDGGFRGSVFETALAFLVLGESGALKPAPGSIP